MSMKIEELDLSVRVWHCLKRAGIDTVEQLQGIPDKVLEQIRGMGAKGMEEIEEKLHRLKQAEPQIVAPDQFKVETILYDIEEIHHNCTVHILRNSVTGEQSIGWWPEEQPPVEV